MSPWGRLGPGVQGLPVLFIATAESNLCSMDIPQSLGRNHLGGALKPRDITLEGLGEEAWEWGCWVGLPLQAPYCPGEPRASALGDSLIIAAMERSGDCLPAMNQAAPQPSRPRTGSNKESSAWMCIIESQNLRRPQISQGSSRCPRPPQGLQPLPSSAPPFPQDGLWWHLRKPQCVSWGGTGGGLWPEEARTEH